jgi:heptosyltransferase-2
VHAQEIGSETIHVRLPNWVGDVVMATPALRALRRAASRARIVLVGAATSRRLLTGLDSFDDFFVLERNGRHAGLSGFLRAARELARDRDRLFVLLPNSISSALLARAARSRCVLGYWSRERFLLLDVRPRLEMEGSRRRPIPMTRLYLDLLRAVGVESSDETLSLAIGGDEEERASAALRGLGIGADEPFFAANPGASFGASKFWTLEGFAGTIRGLHERRGLRTLVLCGPGEEELARSISAAAGAGAVDTSRSPLPLELLKPVLRRARLLVTTDTGPRHIATAFGTPCIVVMGPTDPRHTNSNLEATRVLRVDVDCGPCHLKVCPLDHRCMTRIGAPDALAAADALVPAV